MDELSHGDGGGMDSGGASDGTVGIVVKTMDDSRYDVRVAGAGTVGDLKQAIVGRTGVPVDRQRLIFRGRTLGNAETLAGCSVTEGATVHLVARWVGVARGVAARHTELFGCCTGVPFLFAFCCAVCMLGADPFRVAFVWNS